MAPAQGGAAAAVTRKKRERAAAFRRRQEEPKLPPPSPSSSLRRRSWRSHPRSSTPPPFLKPSPPPSSNFRRRVHLRSLHSSPSMEGAPLRLTAAATSGRHRRILVTAVKRSSHPISVAQPTVEERGLPSEEKPNSMVVTVMLMSPRRPTSGHRNYATTVVQRKPSFSSFLHRRATTMVAGHAALPWVTRNGAVVTGKRSPPPYVVPSHFWPPETAPSSSELAAAAVTRIVSSSPLK